jgi:methylated-DNA-[protein]-cysteine S-methyltransferase
MIVITDDEQQLRVVDWVLCHRVIGANGALTGYGGGLARKQWLLAHEGVDVPSRS